MSLSDRETKLLHTNLRAFEPLRTFADDESDEFPAMRFTLTENKQYSISFRCHLTEINAGHHSSAITTRNMPAITTRNMPAITTGSQSPAVTFGHHSSAITPQDVPAITTGNQSSAVTFDPHSSAITTRNMLVVTTAENDESYVDYAVHRVTDDASAPTLFHCSLEPDNTIVLNDDLPNVLRRFTDIAREKKSPPLPANFVKGNTTIGKLQFKRI